MMNVSIIMTCLNEEKNIERCLNSLTRQNYSNENFEIIVVDGGSSDRTQHIIREFEKKHEKIRMVQKLKKGTASGRNAGVLASNNDYIAFIDADCEAPVDWLSILVEEYRNAQQSDSRVVAVGGGNHVHVNSKNFLIALGISLDSYLGSFKSV
jgi:glycosyltransferase involved in cell wall biosynthesis